MQPLIGITAGEYVDGEETWGPNIYGQPHTYIDAVSRAGGIPVSIPILKDKNALRALYDKLDGILFSGGNDVDPKIYNAKPSEKLGKILRKRDDQEILLFEWAIKDKKPAVAICRGMQVLNVACGGTLYQDIKTERKDSSEHQMSDVKQDLEFIAHCLKIEAGSKLADILGGAKVDTNTRHHQAVKDLGKGLRATAWSEDGIIEAIEIDGDHFLLGVQSHPEALEEKTVKQWRKLFEALVENSKKQPNLQRPEPQSAPALLTR